MRRLTLILSDLYLPEGDWTPEAAGEVPRVHELPAFEQWLRVARSPARVDGWRAWLAQEAGAVTLAQWPVAHVHARAAGIEPTGAWLATPVCLEARLDHVRMARRGLVRLSPVENRELAAEFNAIFGPAQRLVSNDTGALILEGGPVGEVRTVDPARLLEADIAPALPSGALASPLRRLGAEVEMWLPGSRTNHARERDGRRKITALWFWGGGPAVPRRDIAAPSSSVELYGSDSFLRALSVAVPGVQAHAAPGSFDALGAFSRAVVELAPLSGDACDSLTAIDANWFGPAANAMRAGGLERLAIVANDRVFDITPRCRWKFWRRRRHWIAALKA